LLARQPVAQDPWSGLAQVTGALTGSVLQGRANEAEQAGIADAGTAFSALADGDASQAEIIAALSNPWSQQNPGQSAVAQALLNQQFQRDDPAYQLDLDLKRAQLAAAQAPAGSDPTSAIQNYEYLVGTGVDPQKAQAMSFGGGGTTVNNMGNIPAGYEVIQDPATGATRMQAIPGGPAEQAAAAAEAEAAAAAATADTAAGRKDTATDIITSAADQARQVLSSGAVTTGTPGAAAALLPESQAAELRRQVAVMKANATIENLTAMRQASPTGGALGSVTEKEGAMLAAASGALDPNASPEQFARALDNYERTLLQVVHGPVEGERIYQETRKADPNQRVTPSGITFKVLP
jgi:hypothetical protein